MKKPQKKWSLQVTKTSNALALEKNIFKSRGPAYIARSLKRSADASKRRKTTSYQSAMSMLNFYINRAGKNLSPQRKRVLEKSKQELKKIYNK
jgi:hypothetical protein